MKSLKALATTALTVVAITTTAPAQAASITINRDGCTPSGCYRINITGKIELTDYKTLHTLIETNDVKVAVVSLDSPGGNLVGGLLMGLEIHKYGFATIVENKCASVCASMWLAGQKRYVSTVARIGFHQPYAIDRRGRKHADAGSIAVVKGYYAKIGISKPAADFLVAADPNDLYWLNGDLAKGFGIAMTMVTPVEDKPQISAAENKEDKLAVTLPRSFVDRLGGKL